MKSILDDFPVTGVYIRFNFFALPEVIFTKLDAVFYVLFEKGLTSLWLHQYYRIADVLPGSWYELQNHQERVATFEFCLPKELNMTRCFFEH